MRKFWFLFMVAILMVTPVLGALPSSSHAQSQYDPANSIFLPVINFPGSPVITGIYPQTTVFNESTYTVLRDLDNWAGKKNSLIGTFLPLDMSSCGGDCATLRPFELMYTYGYTPFVNLESTKSMSQLLSGAEDAAITKTAGYIKTWVNKGGGRMVFIALLPEMNGNWVPYYSSGSNFKTFYQRVYNIFKTVGVPASAVKWVFVPNGWSDPNRPGDAFENYYPGDAYTDIVAFSGYNFGFAKVKKGTEPCASWVTFQSPDDVFGDYLERMRRMAPGKAIYIAQTGTTAINGSYSSGRCTTWTDNDEKNEWLTSAYNYLSTAPGVKGVLYFNIYKTGENIDWPYYGSSMGNYTGYKAGVNNPFYSYLTPAQLYQTSIKP